MPEQITVKAATQHGRAVLWERDLAHPNGEIFISGNGREHTVAKTPAVQRKLASGELVEVTGKKKVTLKDSEPWVGYDEQTAEEVIAHIANFDDHLFLRRYETANKNRKTVLEALD